MRLWGVVRRLFAWVAVAAVAAPGVALLIVAFLDRDPSGEVRVTALSIGLTAFDRFAWTCLGRSVLVSALVGLGSFWIGVRLGRISSRRRGFGLGGLSTTISAAAVASPLVGALGIRDVLLPIAENWGFWGKFASWIGPIAVSDWIGWGAFIWLGLAGGVPLVALATRAALEGIDATWEDAAKLAGASRARIWRDLAWPMVRPAATASAALVFARAMFDPSVPLVFGLRRSLAFQLVASAMDAEDWPPRTAALALIGVGIVAAVRLATRWAFGAPVAGRLPSVRPPKEGSTAPGALAIFAGLLLGSALSWLPTIASASLAIDPGSKPIRSAIREAFVALAADPETQQLFVASVAIAMAVGILGWVLIGSESIRKGRFRWLDSLPPLAIGLGAMAIPRLLSMASEGLTIRGVAVRVGWPGELGRWLDPYATPGVLLVWSLVSCSLPGLASVAEHARRRSRPILVDAAVVLGVRRSRAARTISRRLVHPPIRGAVVLVAILAATSLVPAIFLAPSSRERPLGPGLLLDSAEPGGIRRAAGLGLAITGLNLLGWAYAGREGRAMLIGRAAIPED